MIGLSLKASPRAVIIQDGFWSQRRKTNQVASIPSIHEELLEHGRMNNFLRLQGKLADRQKGPVYSDSDIYKWAEAVGFQLQVAHNPELRKMTDAIIRDTCLYLLLTDGSGTIASDHPIWQFVPASGLAKVSLLPSSLRSRQAKSFSTITSSEFPAPMGTWV